MISPERLESMQQGFVRLLAREPLTPAEVYPLFDQLVAAHTETHRHYHNLEHLHEMLRVAGRLSDTAQEPYQIQLAIWFHDAVYDSRAHDNEVRSAQFAQEALTQLRIPTLHIDRIQQLILATSHRELNITDPDTAILLDADLAILSAEEKRYRRYAADIRREYEWVEETHYRQGRIQLLESFLARPRIYFTERMHGAAEEAARLNLRNEIDMLKK
jgi:predicted metal-dependent HD superfamily phosphohydrolase